MAGFIESGNKFILLTEIVGVKYNVDELTVGVITRGNEEISNLVGEIVANLGSKEQLGDSSKAVKAVALELLELIALRIDPSLYTSQTGVTQRYHSLLRFSGFREGQSSWVSTELSDFDPRK